jgi:hypothetical protein
VYDALDRRIRKTASGAVTDCLYSGWRCVEDRGVSNDPDFQYVCGICLDEIVPPKNLIAVNGLAPSRGSQLPTSSWGRQATFSIEGSDEFVTFFAASIATGQATFPGGTSTR